VELELRIDLSCQVVEEGCRKKVHSLTRHGSKHDGRRKKRPCLVCPRSFTCARLSTIGEKTPFFAGAQRFHIPEKARDLKDARGNTNQKEANIQTFQKKKQRIRGKKGARLEFGV